VQKTKEFRSTDRYEFDFGECSSKNGFAQLDTGQDTSYYGSWANPWTLKIVNYCEGDIYRIACENVEEFVAEIESIRKWNDEAGWGFRIDAYPKRVKNRFVEIGCGALCH